MKIFSCWVIYSLMIGLSYTATANTFKTEQWKTPNGVQVIFYPAMEVPMLDVSLAFAAGSAQDGAHHGIAALTAHMLNEGNAGLDASTIAEALADIGSQFNADVGRDMAVFNLRTLTSPKALAESAKTLAQIISHPDFPNEAFAREQSKQLMAVEQAQESPENVASLKFFNHLYQQHPYAHSVNGTEQSVKAITNAQILEFYKHYYVGNNAILVLVGAIDSTTAHQLASQLTQELPAGQKAEATPEAQQLTEAQTVAIPFPSSQTVIRLGQIGITHRDPNYFPLLVGNYILGGGSLVSQLAVEIREKRGLTYGIESHFTPMSGKGPFLISLSTQNEQAQKALEIMKQVLTNYMDKGPSDKEMIAAKQYLVGSFPLSLAGNRNIATLLLHMAFYHLPDDFLDTYTARVQAVTREQVLQAFKQQVDLNTLLLVTVGNS